MVLNNLEIYIKEIQWRIIYLIIYLICTFLICFFYSEQLIFLFIQPLNNIQKTFWIYTEITEAIYIKIRLSITLSFYFFWPIFFYHFYQFIIPGVYIFEKIKLKKFLKTSLILYLTSFIFIFYFFLSFLFKFFLEYTQNLIQIQLEAKVSNYLNLILDFVFMFTIFWQIPIFILFCHALNILKTDWFLKKPLQSRKYIYTCIFFLFNFFFIFDFLLLFLFIYELFFILILWKKYVLNYTKILNSHRS